MSTDGQPNGPVNGCGGDGNGSRGSNGTSNGNGKGGCILPWMRRWVWDNSISWEEVVWNRIEANIGCSKVLSVQEERVRGDVTVKTDGGIKEICVTPGDRLSNWWLWKKGLGWHRSTDGGQTYKVCTDSRPLDVTVLVIYAVMSCLRHQVN